MKAVVVGLGEFGSGCARALARSGVETIAIDKEMSVVERIKDEVAYAVCTDATVVDNLKAHGVEDADVLIAAIGRDFEAMVLVVVHASRMGIERIVARASSPIHVRVLRTIGAHEVVTPEQEAAVAIVQRMLSPMGEGQRIGRDLGVRRFKLPEGLAGRTLGDVRDDFLARIGVALFAIERETEDEDLFLLAPDTRLEAGDRFHVGGTEEALIRAASELASKPA